MKTFTAVVFTLFTAAPLAIMAADCKNGILYCGSTLTGNKGWDNLGIRQACREDKWNDGAIPEEGEIAKSLFKCAGSGDSLVWVNNRVPCNHSCTDGGDGKSDYCS